MPEPIAGTSYPNTQAGLAALIAAVRTHDRGRSERNAARAEGEFGVDIDAAREGLASINRFLLALASREAGSHMADAWHTADGAVCRAWEFGFEDQEHRERFADQLADLGHAIMNVVEPLVIAVEDIAGTCEIIRTGEEPEVQFP